MKGKRGDMEQLQFFIIYIVFVLIVFIAFLVFIRNATSGTIAKQQVLAKQIALLIDSSPAGTELAIEKGNFTVTISNKKVEINAEDFARIPYSYEFLTIREIEAKEQDNKIVIKIFK